MPLYFWSSVYIFTAFASSLLYPIVWGGGFNISYKFNVSYRVNIGVGEVVKLGSRGNIGSAICYYNTGVPGIAVGIVRYIRGVIRFLRIIGSSKTL